jgi:hypothetical protein
MRTRWMIGIVLLVGTGVALHNENLAAAYVALAGCFAAYMLHAIEVKLNKLLDHHGIHVSDAEIARD